MPLPSHECTAPSVVPAPPTPSHPLPSASCSRLWFGRASLPQPNACPPPPPPPPPTHTHTPPYPPTPPPTSPHPMPYMPRELNLDHGQASAAPPLFLILSPSPCSSHSFPYGAPCSDPYCASSTPPPSCPIFLSFVICVPFLRAHCPLSSTGWNATPPIHSYSSPPAIAFSTSLPPQLPYSYPASQNQTHCRAPLHWYLMPPSMPNSTASPPPTHTHPPHTHSLPPPPPHTTHTHTHTPPPPHRPTATRSITPPTTFCSTNIPSVSLPFSPAQLAVAPRTPYSFAAAHAPPRPPLAISPLLSCDAQ